MYQVFRLGGGGECTKYVDYRVSVPSVLARG